MNAVVAIIRSALTLVSWISPRLAGKWAFRLFCQPTGRSKIRPQEAATLREAHVEALTVNGKQVRVYRWGDGQNPVLMLHGWESRGSRYAPYVPRLLALGFSPITFDSPGHGDSGGKATTILEYQSVIHDLRDRYGAFRAIIAHSFGVLCAFRAVRTGVAADRIVMVSGVCDFAYLSDEFARRLSLGPNVREDLRRRVEAFFAPETEIWERFSVSHQPSDIQGQLLIVHDENDSVVTADQARKIAQTFGPQAEMVLTRTLGHHRILAEPSIVSRIVAFVADAKTAPQPLSSRDAVVPADA